jgi:hypothetical protein
VKVGSGESGPTQLKRYRDHIDGLPDSVIRELIVLSPQDFRKEIPHEWLSWQAIWSAIRTHATSGPAWNDFRRYLEEISMADDSFTRISAREASSLGDAAALHRKVSQILWKVVETFNPTWPGIWPAGPGYVRGILGNKLWTEGRLVMEVGAKGAPVFLYLGVTESEGEAWLTASVEVNSRRLAEASGVFERVRNGEFPTGWTGNVDSEELLVWRERAVHFESYEEAVTWLCSRVHELESSSYMALVAGQGHEGSVATSAQDDQGLA